MNNLSVDHLTRAISVLREKLRIAEGDHKNIDDLVLKIAKLQKKRFEILRNRN